jgi:ERCC4-type nuclease
MASNENGGQSLMGGHSYNALRAMMASIELYYRLPVRKTTNWRSTATLGRIVDSIRSFE